MRPIDISTLDRLARYLRHRKVGLEVMYGGPYSPKGWSATMRGEDRVTTIETGRTMMEAIKAVIARWEAGKP